MTTIVLLLVASVVVYVMLSRWSRQERAEIGIADETVESTDDLGASMSTLRSARYGLVGRPDQLVRVGRMLIPVEQKPRARRLQPSHVLQVAAQCLLVQEVYEIRPTYGLVILAAGERQRVEFSPALERRLLQTMAQMRALIGADTVPEPYWIAAKCRACGFRQTCWSAVAD